MRPRPFYRSRLFWLGVPGLVFLVWGWWDSGKYQSHVRWARGDVVDQVVVTRGQVEWQHVSDMRGVYTPIAGNLFDADRLAVGIGDEFVLLPEDPDERWAPKMRGRQFDFREAVAWAEKSIVDDFSSGTVETMEFRVALWVIVLSYVVVWMGAVCWWQWRKKRAMNRLTEVEVVA